MIKKFLLLVACVAVVAALMPSYVGAASPSEGTELTAEQQYTQAIDELQRYLSISETGNIVLNAPNSIVKSINGEVYQTLLAGLQQTNWEIDNGYVVCNPDFTLTYTDKYIEAYSQYLEPGSDVVAVGNAITLSSTSGGITACFSYWWGYWIYLSDDACDAIVLSLEAGAGLVALLSGLFPPFTPIGVIAIGIQAIGAAVLAQINTNDTGIKIRLNKTFVLPVPVIPTWIGPQAGDCGVVTGYVTDHATGNALSYSTITATQSGQVIVEVGSDSNGRYSIALSPGTYMVTASHSGYYDLGKPVTVSDGSYTTRDFQLTHSSGGGGCPFLQVWDGSDYVDEGLLSIHNAEGVDVTYEHVLMTVPARVNGAYEFRLVEHPKTISHIDQIQLHAVLEDGTVEELHLMSAQHSEDGNVLNLLLNSDDCRVEEKGAVHNGGTSQSIDLKFTALRPNAKAVGFIFTIEGYNMICKTC